MLCRLRAVYDGFVVTVKLRCLANLILVGDMMRSVALLKFDPYESNLVEVVFQESLTQEGGL